MNETAMSHLLYNTQQMRDLDHRTATDLHLKNNALMERAGKAAFDVLRRRWPKAKRIVVVCGLGNNGGDGYVLARLARQRKLNIKLLQIGDAAKIKGDALTARQAWLKASGKAVLFNAEVLHNADVIVDAIFGIGLARPVQGEWRDAIDAINAAGKAVLAIDVPSGLHADTGSILGVTVHADTTVSFIGLKPGLYTADGPDCSGEIVLVTLGATDKVYDSISPRARLLNMQDFVSCWPRRRRNSHKGDHGRVLVVGGYAHMAGAVRLAGEAAYRTGAGLVTVACDPERVAQVGAACPELLVIGALSSEQLQSPCRAADVVVVGPGLGRERWSQDLWQYVCAHNVQKVVDADALNLLAADAQRCDDWVLTPHPGEAARLLDCKTVEIQGDRLHAAEEIAQRYGGVCVLKGAGTVIAAAEHKPLFICDRGNPGMASAGMGDVLSGVIAALLAQGLTPIQAAQLGVWLHASAGDFAAQERGVAGLLASDLLTYLPKLLQQ